MASIPGDQVEPAVIPDEQFDSTADRRDITDEPNTLLLGVREGSVQDEDYRPRDDPCPNERHAPVPVQYLINEIVSLLVAAASLIALFILLKQCNNKPSPQWSLGHWGFTLKAILSVVLAIFWGSLLMPVAQTINQASWIWYMQPNFLQDLTYYDSASRGPLGSIRLLYTLHFRRVNPPGVSGWVMYYRVHDEADKVYAVILPVSGQSSRWQH